MQVGTTRSKCVLGQRTVLGIALGAFCASGCSEPQEPPETTEPIGISVQALSAPGLVAAYGFDEGGGTAVTDATGNGHDTTLSGQSWTTGKYGGALSFNQNRLSIADSSLLDLDDGMTLSAWVKPSGSTYGWRTVLMKEDGLDLAYGLYASTDPDDEADAVLKIDGDYRDAFGIALADDQWSHLAATFDGGDLKLYVNGTQVAETWAGGSIPTSTEPLRIGGNAVWGEYFSGTIDEIRIYDRALTPAELATDAQTPITPSGPDVTPPTVSMAAPADGATVTGPVALSADATDDVSVTKVTFFVDGVLLAEDTWPPFSVTWDSTQATAGAHSLTAQAEDGAGNTRTSASISVNVDPSALVAAYSFDEGSGGIAVDVSGHGNDAVLSGQTWVTGKYGTALHFDDGYLTVPDADSLDLTQALTLSAWVQPTVSNWTWPTIIMKEKPGGLAYALYDEWEGAAPSLCVGALNEDDECVQGGTVPEGSWTYVAGTCDGSECKMYLDGTLVQSSSQTMLPGASDQPLRIGGNDIWGEYFIGYIDEVRIYARALSQAEIQADMATSTACGGDLDDQNPCTQDACNGGVVSHTPLPSGTSCSDGNVCNGDEVCDAAAACQPGTPLAVDDGNPCTVDACDPAGGVSHDPIADGTACDDSDACSQTDTCQAGTCTGSNPVACSASDQCHDAGSCDPATGLCSDPVKADGATCDDGNGCSQTDTCQAGTCTGANPIVCSASDQCHDAGTCDPATGLCSNPPSPNGIPCDDGNACTLSDECLAGACSGNDPVLCSASDQCHDAGTCNPSTGLCSDPAKADGAACNDGDACSQTDTCQAGTCTGANPIVCSASDQCHDAGTCDSGTGQCSDPVKADGTACNDGDACSQSDTCQAGTCTGSNPVVCSASDQCHDAGTCDPGTGSCSDPAKTDGTACNDGDACSQTDSCQAGTCTGSNPIVCAASDQCHDAGTCDPGTGSCSNPAKTDGTACNDGDACSQTDTCQAGTCTGADPVVCTALDQCHGVGTCDPGTGFCDTPALADGTSCDDADACTQTDECVSGACTGSAPVTCTAADDCHDAGVCDSGTGLCSNPALPDGTPCSDADACTSGDSCVAGGCSAGTPVDTDDGDPCTADSCDASGGITHAPVPEGTACGQGLECNAGGECAASVPELVVPPLDPTVPTTTMALVEHLFTGPDAIQLGVAPDTIEERLVALVSGDVSDEAGAPLGGATVTVVGHPEFGSTNTLSDGTYRMAVNGGGSTTIRVDYPNYLSALRTVKPMWNETVKAEPVVLVQPDPIATLIDADSAVPQIATSSTMVDSSGTREALAYFRPNTSASMILPDGSETPLDTMTLRATEYTVGPDGPARMPAPLSNYAGYTYAVELSVDEATAAGAESVVFDQPVSVYVDNFLGVPVGTGVPAASLDKKTGFWVPVENGRVIQIVGATGAMAELDVDGDSVADDTTTLAQLGIDDDERETLLLERVVGDSLWRVEVTHFSPMDANMAIVVECDEATGECPKALGRKPSPVDRNLECPVKPETTKPGSAIGVESQSLGEALPIAGTPYTLNYRSSYVPGYLPTRTIDVPFDPPTFPSFAYNEYRLEIAGRSYGGIVTGETERFTWDGLDEAGRMVLGTQNAVLISTTRYQGQYATGDRFGDPNVQVVPGLNSRELAPYITTFPVQLSQWDAKAQGLGGWTISAHHVYDKVGGVLYRGDGVRRHTKARIQKKERVIQVAGSCDGCGATPIPPDGSVADGSRLGNADGIDVAANGDVYVAIRDAALVRRIDREGILHTVAGRWNQVTGGPDSGLSGDGGPATEARLRDPMDVAIGPDGSVFIADTLNHRIRRVDADGIIETYAGTTQGFSGDYGQATLAQLSGPSAIDVAIDGSLYILDAGNSKVRRVDTSGIIATVTTRGGMNDIAVANDGTLYMAAGDIISRANGIRYWETQPRFFPYGLPNTWRPLYLVDIDDPNPDINDPGTFRQGRPHTNAQSIAVWGSDVYSDNRTRFAHYWEETLGVAEPESEGKTPQGAHHLIHNYDQRLMSGEVGPVVSGQPAFDRSFPYIDSLAVSPGGTVYFGSHHSNQLYRLEGQGAPLFDECGTTVPSEDQREVYCFNNNGRHAKTFDFVTGEVLLTFTYDSNGQLATMVDGDGNTTTIDRSFGDRVIIRGPYGQETVIGLNSATGYADYIEDPAQNRTLLTHSDSGLLEGMTDARGNDYVFNYDALGRLSDDSDPAGATQTLDRTDLASGYEVRHQTDLGRETISSLTEGPFEEPVSVSTYPDGTQSTATVTTEETRIVTHADGTIVTETPWDDDPLRFGPNAPFTAQRLVELPSGLTLTETHSRDVDIQPVLNNPIAKFTDVLGQTDTTAVNGRTTTVDTDNATHTTTITTPLGRTTTVVKDSQDRVTHMDAPGALPVDFVYDASGRLSTIAQGTRTTTFGYYATSDDRNGYLASITNPLSEVVNFTPDALGRPVSVTQAGTTTSFGYDANGNLAAVTPPGQPSHGQTYTPVNLLASYDPPATDDVSIPGTNYTYDTDRLPDLVSQPDGVTLDYQYDAVTGQLTDIVSASGSRSLTYDSAGRVQTLSGAGVTLTYGYDGFLMLSETLSSSGLATRTVDRTYNNDLEAITQSLSVGSTTSNAAFAFDDDGFLTCAASTGATITDCASASANTRLDLSYSADAAQLTGTTIGNVTDAVTYNQYGELATYTAVHGSEPLYDAEYDTGSAPRDALGRITTKTETFDGVTRATEYTYDAKGQLEDVYEDGNLARSYRYDENGNRTLFHEGSTSIVPEYDEQDRLRRYGSVVYTYTADGDLFQKLDESTNDLTTYTYDAFGSLVSVDLPDGRLIEYTNDARGRRVGKRVDGVLVRQYVWDGQLRIAAELDGAGNLINRYVYALGINSPDLVERGGEVYRVVKDHLGSPKLVVNVTDSSDVLTSATYDEFGNATGTGLGEVAMGFAGGLHDEDTGLVRFGARDYEPGLGRWVSKDTARWGGGSRNLYSYSNSDPINRLDPSGLKDWSQAETAGLMLRYRENLQFYKVHGSGYYFMKGVHGAGGYYDFWGRKETESDTFDVPGLGQLSSAQMGNFMAGVGAQVMDDFYISKILVHLAGSYFGILGTTERGGNWEEFSWENNGFFGDSWDSRLWINAGYDYDWSCH